MRAYTDTHAHLDLVASRLGPGAVEAISTAYLASPPAFAVDIGIAPGDLAGRVARFGHLSFIRFTSGLWPGKECLEDPEASLALLEADLASGPCVALGECGLDYRHMEASEDAQMALFGAQAALARKYGLPLVVHSRDAARDTIEVLRAAALGTPVVIHCFGYGPDEADAFLDLGCRISFAGNLTYRKSASLREACARVPADRLLLETDAPYMNPDPMRGRPSTPLDLARTLEAAASIRDVPVEELAATVEENARAVFG